MRSALSQYKIFGNKRPVIKIFQEIRQQHPAITIMKSQLPKSQLNGKIT